MTVKNIILTLLTILIVSIWDFNKKGYHEFPQLIYDWDQKRTIKDHGNTRTYKLSHNTLGLYYNRSLESIHENNTIEVLDERGRPFYFRFMYKQIMDSIIEFKGGIWLTQIPKKKLGEVRLKEVDIPLIIKDHKISVGFIGITNDKWGGFKTIRKNIKFSYPKINFLGNQKDVFGFEYSTLDITPEGYENNVEVPEQCEIVMILIDKIPEDEDLESIQKLLSATKDKLLLVHTWPLVESMKAEKLEKANNLVRKLNEKNQNIFVIDLKGGSEELAQYDENKGYFLTSFGYSLFKTEVIEIIGNYKD
ncbi:hypothetical protein AB1A65_04280 [Muricauda sp. ANG21]|uniref:hypothetical protein n=1 Tax=Allomuricauda sp. ANG21 TaxID=3042468 RepID=UPI003452F1B3